MCLLKALFNKSDIKELFTLTCDDHNSMPVAGGSGGGGGGAGGSSSSNNSSSGSRSNGRFGNDSSAGYGCRSSGGGGAWSDDRTSIFPRESEVSLTVTATAAATTAGTTAGSAVNGSSAAARQASSVWDLEEGEEGEMMVRGGVSQGQGQEPFDMDLEDFI